MVFWTVHVIEVVVAFSLHAKITDECSTKHSPANCTFLLLPFFFFFGGGGGEGGLLFTSHYSVIVRLSLRVP